MATNKMEVKEFAKPKTLWKMSSTSEPLLVTGIELSPLKKFTIPKIRRTAGKVYLSPCYTNTREYSFIHDALTQCRLDVSDDLQSSWQFGETKLVHNEDLEKRFTAKRTEMRENGRHGRELEEHFCFLALPQSDVLEIYQNGISTKTSTLKILGNPLLGIYIFRHVDVALNYAHSRSITIESIIIFKVLFGKVKKIPLSMDKNKVSLDPSPNFDCHMSKSLPSLKDTVELQAYHSAVYFYEYNVFSKPVDKPRQCLPYAIVTVKFIGQKVDNGHFMTSLRFLSTGFPKKAERTCSLNNCTIAKRIGKGKDATVIFEHFGKPVDPFVQENCSCSTLNSETTPSNTNIFSSYENMQNGNISKFETYSGQTENNLAEIRDSQVHDSGLSFMSSDNRESGNGDLLLNFTYLKNILSGLSAAFPPHNNDSSTVTTSKLIKDPRLMKREESLGKQNNSSGLSEILPFEKNLDYVNSEVKLSSMPANSVSSFEVVPHAILSNCLDVSSFKFSFDDSQSQTQNMDSEDYHCSTSNKIPMSGQCKDQDMFSFPISLSNVISEVENQKYSEKEAQRAQERSSIPLLFEQNCEPLNLYEQLNTCTKEFTSYISQEPRPSNLKPAYQTAHQMSTVFPFQKKSVIDEYIENIGKMKNLTDPEDSSKHGEKQTMWKDADNYFTKGTNASPIENYVSLHQGYKEDRSLDSISEKYDKILNTQELEMTKSPSSTTKNKEEPDHLELELENNLSPGIQCLSQKHQQTLEYEDSIHTSVAIAQKLMELKLEKNQNYVGIMTNAFQEAKDIPQAKELFNNTVTSSQSIETALDKSNCSLTREYTCVQRKSENEPLSLQDTERDCKETSHIEDGQSHILFCNTQLNNDTYPNTNFTEQGDNDKETQNKANKENTASPEDNREKIYGDKKSFYINNTLTNTDEMKDNKYYRKVEIPSSGDLSTTFSHIWEEKDRAMGISLLESGHTVTSVKQRGRQDTGRNVEHLASTMFSDISDSSVGEASNTAAQEDHTAIPVLSTNHENHQRNQFKETCSSENPGLGLFVKHTVSDYKIDTNKSKLHDSFNQSISENMFLLNFELENEIEVETEQCDAHSHGHVLDDESESSYDALKSRIDWEGLFGNNTGETEVSGSTRRKDNSNQHCPKQSICFYSSTQKFLTPILLPDLQVRITNIFRPGFSPTDDSLERKDNSYKCTTKATKPEKNEEQNAPGFKIYYQTSGENLVFPCEDKFGSSTQDSRHVSKSVVCHSSDVHSNAHGTYMPEKQNSESLSTESFHVTTMKECRHSFTKSKIDFNGNRSKKDMDSRISKRKLHTALRDQDMSHKDLRQHEICGKKRLTSQDSSEHFSSLSQGRIKTFSQSEKHIRSVLDILNSEASLCKSKRLSRKLDRAVLHLKKAHKRVHTSLQLITKVGEKRKGPLPRAYAIICNNFWESCDLQDYSSVPERRYYSTKRFLSKRKYDKQVEKKALGFDVDKSAHVSKQTSYKTQGKKIAKSHSKKSVASSVSRSHTSIHLREFHDHEQHPESQFSLFSASQSTSQLEYGNSSERGSRSSELQPFSGKAGCLLYPDEKLIEKENQTDIKLYNSKYKKLENHLVHNKDATKENNSEATQVTSDSNSVSLSCIKEDNLSYSTDKNYETTCIAHTKMKTDILLSVLDSNVKHFLNFDIDRRDNLISGCERNLGINFPIERWIIPVETSKASIMTGSFSMDPFNITLITSKKYNIPQLLSTTSVTDREGESLISYLDKQKIFAIDSFAASMVVSQSQISCGKELLNTEQFSSNSCLHINANKTSVTEYSELGLTSVTEESKNYGKNMKTLSSKDSSLFLQDYKRHSSKKCISKTDVRDRKIRKIEQADKANDSFYKKVTTEISSVKIEYKSQNKILKEKSSHLNIKTVKNKLISFHPVIKNTTAGAVSLSKRVSGQLKKKKAGIKIDNDSRSSYSSKPSILGIHCIPILHDHWETSKVTTLQKKSTLYMNELKKYHSGHHTSLIEELSHILQRVDKASSLQILEEETKICQNSLPLFVEAFERKQECSLEQILISRELLVEQNLWSNCKHKLKPCAIDTLVELQMMMETIQFIENKKRLLKGEPTFRSLLWYDETLYSELLGRPRGYQLQSNFYPAFQGRLKYNAFCELQDYHNQLVELYAETKKEKNSYYAFLKYKRQINECEAIMKQCSDCFDFSLSVPFTCGVNFGDNLGDLETLRKYTLKLIGMYGDSPEVHTYPGKQDHLWIIIEMISSKVNFIKSNEAVTIKISLYGLEHIFFDAAKNLVWKERKQFFSKKFSQKNKEMLLKINEYAFSKLQEIYDRVSKNLKNDPTSSIGLEENTVVSSRKSNELISIENSRLNSTLLSHPDICCLSEILDQAEFADLKKLQELTLKCTDHLEILKKYFHMLQEDDIDNIFITEENVLDILKNHNHESIVLKPAAVETYIEIVMLSETVHFLKNSMAKKLDNQRFRGMLWFDLSLLPELVHCQEKMASFSFLKDNPTECLWNVIETSISELKKDIDIIYKYNEAINCSYALHLFSRELKELAEIKKLLKKSEYSISTYIDFVPYIASINYGNTVTELEHNYSQFSTLLKNVMSVRQKDLGKMAHIMKVMKTIEHMKIICAKDAKLTNSFILCQMLHNRRNISQLRRREKLSIHVTKPEENINKCSTSVKVPSISECLIKNIANFSKKRPITADKGEDSQEKEKNTTVSSYKRQKVNMKDVTEINKEKSTFKHSRFNSTTRSHPKSENETGSSSSDNLKRNYVSPSKVEMQRSLPGSLLPFKNLQDTSTSKSESKTDLRNGSSGTSEYPFGQQENLNSIKKRNINFDAAETKSDKGCAFFATCDQKNIDGTSSEDCKTPSQRCLKTPSYPAQKTHISNVNPGTNDSVVPNVALLSKPVSHSMGDSHINLEINNTVFEHENNEMLTSSIKNSTCTNSPDPMYIQDKIPVPQENKIQPAKTSSEEKYMKDALNSNTVPVGASGSLTPDINQRAEYSFSEQQDEENPKVLNQKVGTCWNELPPSAGPLVYNSSEHSFGTSYPYYAWCVYHYSSNSGSAITHTYQGVASYEVHPPPSGMLTTVSSTLQNSHSNLLYSQYFTYFAQQPQANAFVPVNEYFQSQMPISYNFQPPVFQQYASCQALPQAPYPYPPNPGVRPEVPWIYAPWQQEPFQPGR